MDVNPYQEGIMLILIMPNLYLITPAKTTTPVVPSPISLSWDLESSTKSRAVGCYTLILKYWTSIFSTIVAPSFVTTISPSGDYNILSIPFGPIDDRSVLDIVLAAMIFYFNASIPFILFFASYSFIIIKGRPNSSNAKLISYYL